MGRLLRWLGLRRRSPWEPQTLLDHLLASPLAYLTTLVYRLLLLLRGRPFHPPRGAPPVRVVCLADTHDQTLAIPPGDILIHAGDLTTSGRAHDIQRQVDWLAAQPHPLKILVAGNHDNWFDPDTRHPADVATAAAVDLKGLDYLHGDLVTRTVRGRRLSIFGAPEIPRIGGPEHAFQYTTADQPWFSRVHPRTDILVTHTPPRHHRDLAALGCPHLLRELWRVRPRLHVFGHVHWGAGAEPAYFDPCQAAYERLLSRPPRGLLGDLVPHPGWLDAAMVLCHGLHAVLWKWLMAGPRSNSGSLLVNAAQMHEPTKKVRNRAVVVDI